MNQNIKLHTVLFHFLNKKYFRKFKYSYFRKVKKEKRFGPSLVCQLFLPLLTLAKMPKEIQIEPVEYVENAVV